MKFKKSILITVFIILLIIIILALIYCLCPLLERDFRKIILIFLQGLLTGLITAFTIYLSICENENMHALQHKPLLKLSAIKNNISEAELNNYYYLTFEKSAKRKLLYEIVFTVVNAGKEPCQNLIFSSYDNKISYMLINDLNVAKEITNNKFCANNNFKFYISFNDLSGVKYKQKYAFNITNCSIKYIGGRYEIQNK